MALVNMRELLYHAYDKHYAVGAFDIVSLDFLQGVLQGAEACRAPVILNFVVPQFKYYDFELLVAAAVAGAQRSPVPIALNLDHAPDLDSVIHGIRHGCNGVMIDASQLSFEKNVELTRTVVQTAHACGIPVEGELGVISGYSGDDQAADAQAVYTWPDEAKQYVRQTKVDFLAVSVGTSHGMRQERSNLDLERLTRINRAVGIPLVIHGGSGLTDAQCECLIDRGVARINYYSGLSQLAARRLRSNCLIDRTGGAAALSRGVVEVIGREVQRCLGVWGAAGRAEAVLAEVSPWREVEHLIIYNSSGDEEEPVREIMAEGQRVLSAIPGVRRVFTGRALKEGAKYRYCWLVRFAHPKVIDSYREHPDHVAFADTRFRPLSAGRISIDYEAVEPPPGPGQAQRSGCKTGARVMGGVLSSSELSSLELLHRGKVRDIYAVDAAHLLIVATDRLSAFDVVLPTPIPDKGRVLTALSRFWFRHLDGVVANHMTDRDPLALVATARERDQLAGRSLVVRRLAPLPIEAIVRGYLVGSGWRDYTRTGAVCGIRLPGGLREAERLEQPIFTPSTKAAVGAHDENIDFDQAAAVVGRGVLERLREVSLQLYRRAAQYALTRGIIIADTKFEFALDEAGELVLIDEVFTPDSSRFWPADGYAPGRSPPSFDKQYVRDHLEAIGWNKRPPAPSLPAEVTEETARKYREALARLAGDGG